MRQQPACLTLSLLLRLQVSHMAEIPRSDALEFVARLKPPAEGDSGAIEEAHRRGEGGERDPSSGGEEDSSDDGGEDGDAASARSKDEEEQSQPTTSGTTTSRGRGSKRRKGVE